MLDVSTQNRDERVKRRSEQRGWEIPHLGCKPSQISLQPIRSVLQDRTSSLCFLFTLFRCTELSLVLSKGVNAVVRCLLCVGASE